MLAPRPSRHSSSTTPRSFSTSVGIERDAVGPVAHDADRAIEKVALIGRNGERVDGLVERCVRVEVGAERDAALLEHVDERLLRKAGRPVEPHVLDEVGEAALVVVFEDGARVHGEPDLRAVLRLFVWQDVVREPARELAGADPRVEREGRIGRSVAGRGRRRARGRRRRDDGCCRRAARGGDDREEESKREGGETHGRKGNAPACFCGNGHATDHPCALTATDNRVPGA